MKEVILLQNHKGLKRGDKAIMDDDEAINFCGKMLGIIVKDYKYENKMMDRKLYERKSN